MMPYGKFLPWDGDASRFGVLCLRGSNVGVA